MTDTDGLEALAASVRRSLHWAVFLLGCMALILVIDLQLKRSVARQAVNASVALSNAVVLAGKAGGGGRSGAVDPSADDGDHRDRSAGDHVDGGAGMAAGGDEAGGPVPAAPRRRAPRAGQRAPGDG